jgi:spore coat polysaccharide biosynthesis predicted glycosyltransferase SpsG
MALDDTYQKHHCDILLNHNICGDKSKYEDLVPANCELRCGAKYTLLRDEFIQEKNITREKIYDYLIAMGGSDISNLNIPILEVLEQFKPNQRIVVITTMANANLQDLKEFIKNKPNITLEINSTQIAKLINQSKLAIITPSVTANEVYFLDIPLIAIKVAENQLFMYEFLEDNGFFVLEQFDKTLLKHILFKGRL